MQKRNIVWLASYPKSGNTWFRFFLSALLSEADEVDVNGLKTDGIFGSREIFNAFTDLDSRYLYDEEVKQMLPHVYQQLSNEVYKPQYIKVHDACTLNKVKQPIIPVEATKAAVYIIRNPLDIVASFAHHMGTTIDEAVKQMNSSNASLATQRNNLNTTTQLKQTILSWSEHVESWTTHPSFPVLVIRYEDMLSSPLETFTKAVAFMGINTDPQRINVSIIASDFNKLRQKEDENGFKEKTPQAKRFFRSGSAGNWINELTKEQAVSIIHHHGHIMKKYGYDTSIEESFS
jgi:hypothetical protein